MRNFSLLALAVTLSQASCGLTHPGPAASPVNAARPAPVALHLTPADSLVAQLSPPEERPGLDRAGSWRFFRRRHPSGTDTLTVAPGTALVLPRKMRHSQLTVVIGNGNDTRATAIGKAKAPTQVATDSSTQNAVTGGGDLAAANGTASTASPAHTETAAPGPLATLAGRLTGPLGWVLALAGVGALGYGLYYFWFLLPRRKAQNPA